VSTPLLISDEVAAGIAAEAAKRDMTPDALATQYLAEHLPVSQPKKGRRFSFTAVGESTSGRTAAEAEEMLAEGFGR
jgi:hypothetical protein